VGEPIELVGRTQRLTLEIILRAVFGLDPGPRLDALRGYLTEMLTFGDRAISVMPPPRNRYTEVLERVGPFAEFVRTQRKADRLIFELVEERRRDGDAGDDVLSMLIEARHGDGSPMSQDELRDELMTLLVAGHETTASSLAWGFERLARSPDVVAGLRDEIDAGSGDAYLTATIQEILRRRPVLPNAEPRLVRKPIEVGGWAYPTGVCLVPSVYLVHHDPAIYPDPYEFRPERFLDRTPGTYTWIPFGGGRRRCVGASFATLEMKVVLETVLARADVRPAGDGVELARRRNITVRPAAGGRVVLSPARVPAATR
jgi:cytochrome P450